MLASNLVSVKIVTKGCLVAVAAEPRISRCPDSLTTQTRKREAFHKKQNK
jgi:hypothetical protein